LHLGIFIFFSFYMLFWAAFYSTHKSSFQLIDHHLLWGFFFLLHFYLVSWNMVFSLFISIIGLLHHSLLPPCFFIFEWGYESYLFLRIIRSIYFDLRWQTQHFSLLHILISTGTMVLRAELMERSSSLDVRIKTSFPK